MYMYIYIHVYMYVCLSMIYIVYVYMNIHTVSPFSLCKKRTRAAGRTNVYLVVSFSGKLDMV